jgi:hypothetical protein
MSLLVPDLTHADWWIRVTVKLLQSVDTSLRFITRRVGKTQHLIVKNISEETLEKLFFLVNTDQNNNYGYLEVLQVFTKDDYSRTPVPIPGFSTLANAIWNEADAKGFVAGETTQTAFAAPLNNPFTNVPLTVSQYVDLITAIIPWAPKTLGKEKVFTLVLNPDSELLDRDTITFYQDIVASNSEGVSGNNIINDNTTLGTMIGNISSNPGTSALYALGGAGAVTTGVVLPVEGTLGNL